MAGMNQDKSELRRLKAAFQKLDANNDGHISTTEIRTQEKELREAALGREWKEVLKQCDLDGDGKMDFHEFFTAAVAHKRVITR